MDAPFKHRQTGAACHECDSPVDSKGGWGLCKSHYRAKRQAAIKRHLVDAMGGACSKCGGVFPLCVYDFHHLGEKDDSISYLIANGSLEALEAEAAKCVLLCANCHRMEHHGGC